MEKLLDLISKEVGSCFAACGYDAALGRTTISNRPDLCEFQCNGAMAGAKQYHKAPFMIADEVVEKLRESKLFSDAQSVKPGFLNLKLSEEFLASYLNEESKAEKYGLPAPKQIRRIVLDYGGPNVAKPLHIGHLRSAIIGESLKRIARYNGQEVIGDIHMGDWGLQMGLIITELKKRSPELPYFDEAFEGAYPAEAPFTVSDLEQIYPAASAKSKEDPAFYAEAMENTHRLQTGDKGYRALWEKIIDVSVTDLKKNYAKLDVSFELWNGESTVNDLIPSMVESMKESGKAYVSEGALVVDVAEEKDPKEIPPCIILKSDGAALYTTTDLATILDRMNTLQPEAIVYLTDKRQELHFTQVFRTARKCGLLPENVELRHIGFGTMNGKDGKPFKTRTGGVMRLETLIADVNKEMLEKISGNEEITPEEAERTASIVAMAALKYGDLSNQAAKDYIFDIEKFCSFEGDTGPYILYTMVRIKSILAKYAAKEGTLPVAECTIGAAVGTAEKNLQMTLGRFGEFMSGAYEEWAPHKLAGYIYEVSNEFNSFYHGTRILAEEDAAKQQQWIALLKLTLGILEDCIECLGFEAPEKM